MTEQQKHAKELAEKYGLVGHPKADLLYAKAYELGHAYGFSEIEFFYSDLCELVTEDGTESNPPVNVVSEQNALHHPGSVEKKFLAWLLDWENYDLIASLTAVSDDIREFAFTHDEQEGWAADHGRLLREVIAEWISRGQPHQVEEVYKAIGRKKL